MNQQCAFVIWTQSIIKAHAYGITQNLQHLPGCFPIAAHYDFSFGHCLLKKKKGGFNIVFSHASLVLPSVCHSRKYLVAAAFLLQFIVLQILTTWNFGSCSQLKPGRAQTTFFLPMRFMRILEPSFMPSCSRVKISIKTFVFSLMNGKVVFCGFRVITTCASYLSFT